MKYYIKAKKGEELVVGELKIVCNEEGFVVADLTKQQASKLEKLVETITDTITYHKNSYRGIR